MLATPPTLPLIHATGHLAAERSQVDIILDRIESLPALSTAATKLLGCKSASDVNLAEVIGLIEADPALSARLLQLCRSSSSGLGDRITTVKRAVLMVGLDAVRSAALSISVYNRLNTDMPRVKDSEFDSRLGAAAADAGGPLTFDREGFWQYSVGVACCAEAIAQMHPRLNVLGAEAFLAGLLHGIGKLVLEFALPKAYASIVRLARFRAADSATIEQSLLGLDYLTAGRNIAQRWGLPSQVCSVIWQHNLPPASICADQDKSLILMVIAARSLAKALHLGWSGDFSQLEDPQIVWADCKFDQTEQEQHQLANVSAAALANSAERFAALGLTPNAKPARKAQGRGRGAFGIMPEVNQAPQPHAVTLACLQRANHSIHAANERAEQHAVIAANANRLLETLGHLASLRMQTEQFPACTVTHFAFSQATYILLNAHFAARGGVHALLVSPPPEPGPREHNKGEPAGVHTNVEREWSLVTLSENGNGTGSGTRSGSGSGMPTLCEFPGPGTLGLAAARVVAYTGGPLNPTPLNVLLAGLGPWLAGVLGPNVVPASMRILTLSPTGGPMAALGCARALLVSNKELRSESALGVSAVLDPLVSAWWHRLFPSRDL